ncbi:halomucin, putative [Babesia caballi]|uniref:Halomucin, putative n=1 Tax=Babesia caballi TaxID=5871 RepID=A0AAV4M2I2_BABCB|nr:halomucin, putative [Babesia caballi]
MADWWDVIPQPTTLKATFELLTAIRTDMVLRNTICSILLKEINKNGSIVDKSKIGSFHELLNNVTELRQRILGGNQIGYGDYETLHKCCTKTHYCDGTARACSNKILKHGDSSGACFLNIRECATRIVEVLINILPKLYVTLIAVLTKLWHDGSWRTVFCNHKDGRLYKMFTSSGNIHSYEKCPYFSVKQLPFGFRVGDMQSKDPGYTITDVIEKLVGDSGCLRTLIQMMKNSQSSTVSLSNYPSIGTIDNVGTWSECKCPDAKPSKTTTPIIKPLIRPRRSVPRPTVKRPRQKIHRTTSDKIQSTKETKNQTKPVNTDPSVAKAPDTRSVASDITTRPSTIATTLPNDNAAANVTNRDTANEFPFMNPYYVTGSYQKNNYKWDYDSRTSMYSEAPSQPTIYNITAAQSTQSNSNCAASGVAAGCLLVGCVGVGAAYGFNLGGFGTMVNSLF